MSYTTYNYPSKAAIKRDLARGVEIHCYNPGLGGDLSNFTGVVSLEGPHFPEPHRWYGQGVMKDGKLIKIR